MTCNASVHVMQRPTGSRWMRHSSADQQRCAIAAASGPEGYEHELLKFWLRDWFRGHDYKADCEKRVGPSIPDVSAIAPDGHKLALEVQLAHLNEDEAQRLEIRRLQRVMAFCGSPTIAIGSPSYRQ